MLLGYSVQVAGPVGSAEHTPGGSGVHLLNRPRSVPPCSRSPPALPFLIPCPLLHVLALQHRKTDRGPYVKHKLCVRGWAHALGYGSPRPAGSRGNLTLANRERFRP